jgi:glycosyltransferase involved in cell wall biosynthesis
MAQKARVQTQRHMVAHLDALDYSHQRASEVRAGAEEGLRALRAKGRIERMSWFIPYFRHPYGGVHTLFRFGELLRQRHGVRSEFIVYDNPNASGRELETRATTLFRSLQGAIRILRSPDELQRLPETDVAVATLWTSAYSVLRHPRATVRAYFVQDFEPLFYPAGTFYGLAEQTYRMGFYGLFNTRGLHDFVTTHYPMQGTWFEPAVDADVFHARRPEPSGGPLRVFFYGRPSTDRNAFELGIASLIRLKRELGPRVEIVSAGEPWNPENYGAQGLVENLGVLPYEKTGELYRSCDVGLCFMFTKHPSYLPFEMMACGVTVVTNDNPANHWLLEHDQNCLLAEPVLSCVVEQLRRAVEDHDLRGRIGVAAAARVSQTTWEAQVDRVYRGILQPPAPKGVGYPLPAPGSFPGPRLTGAPLG